MHGDLVGMGQMQRNAIDLYDHRAIVQIAGQGWGRLRPGPGCAEIEKALTPYGVIV
jgi:hypothetical protein